MTQNAPSNADHLSSEAPLVVFISSAIRGMEEERQAVRDAIQGFPLTRPWLFECTPPSSLPLEESYLSNVKKCDLFVLLVGDRDSEAVRKELQTAIDSRKPILAYVRTCYRSPELQNFVDSLPTKYYEYASRDDLVEMAHRGIIDEVVLKYRAQVKPEYAKQVAARLQPKSGIRSLSDALAYTILGLGQNESQPLLESTAELFGGKRLGNAKPVVECGFEVEEVCFDDFNEAQEALGILIRVALRANSAEGDREAAFFRALTEELAPRLSQYVVEQTLGTQSGGQTRSAGFRYLILGVRKDYAPFFQAVRFRQLLGEQISPKHDYAPAILFRDFTGLQMWVDGWQKAGAVVHDKEKVLQIIVEAALRYNLGKFPGTN